MSYYYQHEFRFSYHGLQRCKERLHLQDLDEHQVKEVVMEQIKKSTRAFETAVDWYISAGNTDLYFVINKQSKLILTLTKISPDKQLLLLGFD